MSDFANAAQSTPIRRRWARQWFDSNGNRLPNLRLPEDPTLAMQIEKTGRAIQRLMARRARHEKRRVRVAVTCGFLLLLMLWLSPTLMIADELAPTELLMAVLSRPPLSEEGPAANI